MQLLTYIIVVANNPPNNIPPYKLLPFIYISHFTITFITVAFKLLAPSNPPTNY